MINIPVTTHPLKESYTIGPKMQTLVNDGLPDDASRLAASLLAAAACACTNPPNPDNLRRAGDYMLDALAAFVDPQPRNRDDRRQIAKGIKKAKK